MDLSIIEHISNYSFPVIMCFILMRYIQVLQNEHKQEMKCLSDTLNENTKAINNLTEKIKEVL